MPDSLIDFLKNIDTHLFLFLNGSHNYFFDVVMYWVANKSVWIPFYLLLILIVSKKFKNKTLLILGAVMVLITLTDQTSVHLFKNIFQRYRPCHNLQLQGLVHVVGNCGGMYGFISSHAANSFALATFLSLLFKSTPFTWFIFLWATLVSYSRIYTGVHYPADVAVGEMVGVFLAWIVFRLYYYIDNRLYKA